MAKGGPPALFVGVLAGRFRPGSGVQVAVRLAVGDAVGVHVGVCDGVWLGVCDGVRVAVALGVRHG